MDETQEHSELQLKTKNKHAHNVLSSFGMLRDRGAACDFTINVDERKFPVHRSLLAACSEYFRAMFEHDMMESKQGYVDMKDVTIVGVEQCLTFIYRGEASVNVENVQAVVHAASVIQLTLLVDYCFKYLLCNISHGNCLYIRSLAQLYSRPAERDKAERYAIDNFRSILMTAEFQQLNFGDIVTLLKGSLAEYQTCWLAVTNWVEFNEPERGKYLLEFLHCIAVSKIPIRFLLKSILKNALVESNSNCKEYMVSCIFSRLEDLKQDITLENCFWIKTLARESNIKANTDKVQQLVYDFLVNNFQKASKEEGFLQLDEVDIISLLESSKLISFKNATSVCEAILRWIKCDSTRHPAAYSLLKLLKFEDIPLTFIQQTLLPESVIKQSHECKDLLMDVICSKAVATTLTPSQKDFPQASNPRPKPRKSKYPDTMPQYEFAPEDTTEASNSGCIQGAVRPSKETKIHSTVGCEKSTIAVLDQKDGTIYCIDSDSLTRTGVIRTPENTKLLRIVGLNGALFALCNDDLYQYDGMSEWRPKASLSGVPDNRTLLVAFQQRIYAIEACDMSYYFPPTNKWTEDLPNLDLGAEFAVTASDEYIFVLGGHVLRDEVWRYTPKGRRTSRWTEVAAMRESRNSASAAEFNGKIYVLGGYDGGKALSSIERYNITCNVWEMVPSSYENMNYPRRRFTAFAFDAKLYAVGGSFECNGRQRNHSDHVEVLNLKRMDGWVSHFDQLPTLDLPIFACCFTSRF